MVDTGGGPERRFEKGIPVHVQQLYSLRQGEAAAARELRQACKVAHPKWVIYFASPRYEAAAMARAMHEAFAGVPTLGCSTAGELIGGRMLNQAVVALVMDDQLIADVQVCMAEGLRDDAGLDRAARALAAGFGAPSLRNLPADQYVGLLLIDGMSGSEERINDRLSDLTPMPFVGGSAGDALQFKKTFVMVGPHACSDACALAVIKPAGDFGIVKTQSFLLRPIQLVPTRVDLHAREVIQFNHKPATQAYAAALGVTVDKLEQLFQRHPLGLVTDHGLFVRSPRQIKGQTIAFYCQVREGMALRMLDGTNMVADTQAAMKLQAQQMGGLDAVIHFNCILRTVELIQDMRTQAYADIFTACPTVGFSTYGESYLGHMNQTATLLALRRKV